MYDVFATFMMAIVAIDFVYLIVTGRGIENFDLQTFGKSFIVGTILCALLIAIQLYKKKILDRIVLGLGLFLLIGSMILLANNISVMYFYNTYMKIISFISIFIVGVITTWYTPAGFIAAPNADKKDVQIASLKLLIIVLLAGIWSLCIDDNFWGIVLPLIVVRSCYDKWGRQLRGEKSWTFKW
jgi:predicted ABC-type exoprotein transport system permease subunit